MDRPPDIWINPFVETTTMCEHLLTIDEPLFSIAPSSAHVHCCYLRTTVFYVQPWETDSKGNYKEYDRVDSCWDLLGRRWTMEDIGFAALVPWIIHNGMVYELMGARVLNFDGRWVKRWQARRVPADDRKLAQYQLERGEHAS